jgi:rhamnose transport system permease protein
MTDQAASTSPAPRVIPDRLSTGATWWKRWETILLVVAIVIFAINSFSSPYFLDAENLSRATFNFTEQAIIGFAMALLIIAGEIDLSVAAIIAISSVAMGYANTLGAPALVLVVIGPVVGVLAGAVNGFIVTRFRVPSIVVTIGTMSLYRGIAYVVLGDQVFRKYPPGFSFFGQGYVVWVVSFEFVLFLVLAVVFGIVLHLTTFGRRIYAIGNNPVAALFSGIPVDRIRFFLFCLTGLMSGIASVLLTSRIGSTRPTIATGYELQAITMVVLGGVNILGGAGTIGGVVIAAFIMGLVTFGLGLLNVPGIVQSIVTGVLLIVVIAIPILYNRWRSRRK